MDSIILFLIFVIHQDLSHTLYRINQSIDKDRIIKRKELWKKRKRLYAQNPANQKKYFLLFDGT